MYCSRLLIVSFLSGLPRGPDGLGVIQARGRNRHRRLVSEYFTPGQTLGLRYDSSTSGTGRWVDYDFTSRYLGSARGCGSERKKD